MMVRQITQINWRYIGDALPSFIVMAFIPFSYSVALACLSGILVYAVLNGLVGLVGLVYLSAGRVEPREYDFKEYRTWKGAGRAPWFVRAIRAHRRRQTADGSSEHGINAQHGHRCSILDSRAESSAKEYAAATPEPAGPAETASQ